MTKVFASFDRYHTDHGIYSLYIRKSLNLLAIFFGF